MPDNNIPCPIQWHSEFAHVIACKRCTKSMDPKLLRDRRENVPQPGFIGVNYSRYRLVFVGQNPGAPGTKESAKADRPYTALLRDLRDEPTPERYAAVTAKLRDFMLQWSLYQYFPLEECKLTLDDIAYFNLVRCRIQNNKRAPLTAVSNACIEEHFLNWIKLLQPRGIVFAGWWALGRSFAVVKAGGIPYTYIDRSRSLSADDRNKNRKAVVKFIRRCMRLAALAPVAPEETNQDQTEIIQSPLFSNPE